MSDSFHAAAASLVVEQASADAIAALRAVGIRPILLKGPPQQQWLAAAGPPRASVDVDLLVAPQDVQPAGRALAELGYALEQEVTPGVEHHAHLWNAPTRVSVEVHWNLWGTDPDRVWAVLADQIETAEIGGALVDIPNEAARCLIVALHAAHHGAGETGPPYDLERALVIASRAAWDRALSLARAAGAESSFGVGLGFVQAGQELRRALGLDAIAITERAALAIAPPVPGAPGFYSLGQQRGILAKARFIAHKIVPPPEFMRFKYPLARRGTVFLGLAYVYRAGWIVRWSAPGLRAWLRARQRARRSH